MGRIADPPGSLHRRAGRRLGRSRLASRAGPGRAQPCGMTDHCIGTFLPADQDVRAEGVAVHGAWRPAHPGQRLTASPIGRLEHVDRTAPLAQSPCAPAAARFSPPASRRTGRHPAATTSGGGPAGLAPRYPSGEGERSDRGRHLEDVEGAGAGMADEISSAASRTPAQAGLGLPGRPGLRATVGVAARRHARKPGGRPSRRSPAISTSPDRQEVAEPACGRAPWRRRGPADAGRHPARLADRPAATGPGLIRRRDRAQPARGSSHLLAVASR